MYTTSGCKTIGQAAWVIGMLLTISAVSAQTRPAGEMLRDRFERSLEQLDLTEAQQSAIAEIRRSSQDELEKLLPDIRDGSEDARQRGRQLARETRQRVLDQLTPEQRGKLTDLLERRPPPPGAETRTEEKSGTKPAEPMSGDSKTGDGMMGEGMTGDPMTGDAMSGKTSQPQKPTTRKTPAEKTDAFNFDKGPVPQIKVGDPAPDFLLRRIDGRPAALGGFKGKILVLIFGSYSTPSFREKAEDFETLRKLTGLRAEFLYIYTREAHPVGGWEVERNRKLEIAIEQPQTEEARLALAKRSRDELKIGIPIAPDTMDDAVAKAYGLVPNGAVVIGRDGKVLAIQRWAEPYALRERINEAVAAPATRPAAQ